MKAAVKALRNKEIVSYEASRVLSVPQTTPERCVEDWQKSSSEAIKQNSV
jgi:hypothetical protein